MQAERSHLRTGQLRRPSRSRQVRPWWAQASSLYQQRRTHLHRSPLQQQNKGCPPWSSPLRPLTSMSTWMHSTKARRSDFAGWTTSSATGKLLGWQVDLEGPELLLVRAIKDNQTWHLVEPLAGCRPIGLKWVYKVKRDEHGAIVKYKAQLVAHGFVQREGIDFEEVFAPMACMESVRLLLAMVVSKDWRVHHLDVKSAFLNGELAETVFVKQAPRFTVKGAEHKVLNLRKALYGLRQVPRAWNAKLDHSGRARVHLLRHKACPVCGRFDRHWRTRKGR